MNTQWKTEKWFTSPWNFDDDTVQQYHFAKNIKLHDVSLRDGEQQAGLIFNKDQKVMLAEKMAEVGIHRIEAGMPAVSKQDEDAIREIVKRDFGPEIFAFARCVKDDVRRAADTGVKGVVIEIPSSEHVIDYAYGWSLEKAIDLSVEATALAGELGLYTVFFPIDMTRADIDWVLKLIRNVESAGHMDALAVVDTFGGLNPHSVQSLIRRTKAVIKKPIEVHFHDDFGLGSANTLMALAAGADVAHTTISSIGERAGNAAYEEVALSLLTMYGIDIGLRYDKIYDLAATLKSVAGLTMRPNRCITGETINNIESGIVSGWYANCNETHPLELAPYLPSLTGHPDSRVVLGKFSGISSVDIWLEKYGVDLEKAAKMEIVAEIKKLAYEKMRLLTEEEFKEIVHTVAPQTVLP